MILYFLLAISDYQVNSGIYGGILLFHSYQAMEQEQER